MAKRRINGDGTYWYAKTEDRFRAQYFDLDGRRRNLSAKTNKEIVRNLVLFPEIDKFYALNSHLVNSSIKNEMKSLACCYDLVKKRTGYCYFNEGYNTGFNITVKQKEIFDAGSFRAIATADAVALS